MFGSNLKPKRSKTETTVSNLEPQDRLGKDRLGKDSIGEVRIGQDRQELHRGGFVLDSLRTRYGLVTLG